MAKFLKERSRYLINKSKYILLGLILFSLSLIFVVPDLYLQYLYPLVVSFSSEILWLFFFAVIVLIVIAKKVADYWEKISDNYDQGDTGELKVQEILKQLPDDYQVIPDVQKPNGGNIDFVVVGPTGIFAVEVKNFKGAAAIDFDGKSLTANGKTFDKDPLGQTISNAITIGNFLQTELKQPYLMVIPVLVFAGRQILRFGLKPVKSTARVIRSEYLLEFLTQKGNIALSAREVEKVAEKIKTAFTSP